MRWKSIVVFGGLLIWPQVAAPLSLARVVVDGGLGLSDPLGGKNLKEQFDGSVTAGLGVGVELSERWVVHASYEHSRFRPRASRWLGRPFGAQILAVSDVTGGRLGIHHASLALRYRIPLKYVRPYILAGAGYSSEMSPPQINLSGRGRSGYAKDKVRWLSSDPMRGPAVVAAVGIDAPLTRRLAAFLETRTIWSYFGHGKVADDHYGLLKYGFRFRF